MLRAAFIFLTLLLATPLSARTLVITDDQGGSIADYNQRYQDLQSNHVQVVFDGACVSACTRFMTLPDACATRRATFWFHGVQKDGALDVEAGKQDSWRWDTPAAWALETRYNTFAMGFLSARPAAVLPQEHGVDKIYVALRSRDGAPRFQEFLRVKASLLVPSCR